MIRITVYFSGRVQGVGFRYTVVNISRRFEVAGYVQNLPDRRVRLVAEGERSQVRGLIDAIHEQMGQYVTAADETPAAATGEFAGTFDVRY